MQIIDVPVRTLTAEAFEPFGAVIQGGGPRSGFKALPNRMMNLEFEADGRAALYVIRYTWGEMRVSRFERHLTMTEARVSLGEPVVVVVAEGTTSLDPQSMPPLETASAFLIGGNQGFIFKRGIWHSLDCYPIAASFADFAFFTEREAEDELALLQEMDPDRCRRSHIVDIAKLHGKVLRVTDPQGLLVSCAQ